MPSRRIVWLDVETGGLDPQLHSLLSVAAVVTDRRLEVLDQDSFLLRHPAYTVDPDAMRVNGLSLERLDNEGILPAEGARRLRGLLEVARTEENGKTLFPVLGGHNVTFDVGFVQARLLPDLPDLVTHSRVDTKPVAEFLVDAGLLTAQGGLGLAALARQFEIAHAHPHDALCDILTTIELYRHFLTLASGVRG